jgi:hypothetical protein
VGNLARATLPFEITGAELPFLLFAFLLFATLLLQNGS